MDVSDNSLIRSLPCDQCGARMLWTQSAVSDPNDPLGDRSARAAYTCLNGHILDPAQTPQCPSCGIHDTAWDEPRGSFLCRRCGAAFTVPR